CRRLQAGRQVSADKTHGGRGSHIPCRRAVIGPGHGPPVGKRSRGAEDVSPERRAAAGQPKKNASVPIPKFAKPCSTLSCELRNPRDTSKSMILVPLLNPKFAIGFAARACELRVRGTSPRGTAELRHGGFAMGTIAVRCAAALLPLLLLIPAD